MLGRGRVLCVGALCSESRLQGLCAPTLQCWRSTPHPEVRTAGRMCSASSCLPRKHSPRLGARVLVAAPADRLGPLPMVTQVPLDHVVISSAPAAVFGELDPWREGSLLWGLGSPGPPLSWPRVSGTVSSGGPEASPTSFCAFATSPPKVTF